MILFGISNCDTVRKARKYLEANHVDYTFQDFRKDGLTLSTIKIWLESQAIEIIVNKRSTGWKQLSDEQKLQLMAGYQLELLTHIPTLIRRPVLQSNSHLLFGFKEADYQKAIKYL